MSDKRDQGPKDKDATLTSNQLGEELHSLICSDIYPLTSQHYRGILLNALDNIGYARANIKEIADKLKTAVTDGSSPIAMAVTGNPRFSDNPYIHVLVENSTIGQAEDGLTLVSVNLAPVIGIQYTDANITVTPIESLRATRSLLPANEHCLTLPFCTAPNRNRLYVLNQISTNNLKAGLHGDMSLLELTATVLRFINNPKTLVVMSETDPEIYLRLQTPDEVTIAVVNKFTGTMSKVIQ